MRNITSHAVNPANERLQIEVVDAPGAGGASHRYVITGFDAMTNKSFDPKRDKRTAVLVLFQNGAIGEVGVNGVTHEALLAIVADRLECFQQGPFACDENAEALHYIREAQAALHLRTAARAAAGIEGTHEKRANEGTDRRELDAQSSAPVEAPVANGAEAAGQA